MAKKKSVPTSEPSSLTSNPFAKLADLGASSLPEQPGASAETKSEKPAPSATDRVLPERAIVRYQRKGRGGKEVTLVELRGVPAGELEIWLSELKKAMGCGGFLEDHSLVLAGDQRDRLRGFLARRGVTRISVS